MLWTDTSKNSAIPMQVSFALTRYVTGVGLGKGVLVKVGKGVMVGVCVAVAVAVSVDVEDGGMIASGVCRWAK